MSQQQNLILRLSQGATVFTGNKRLARALDDAYSGLQLDQGISSWATPKVLPFNAWLNQQWEDSLGGQLMGFDSPLAGRRVLQAYEEQWVWREIIDAASQENSILQSNALAAQAAEAWASMQAARLGFDDWDGRVNDDAVAFSEWSRDFEARCTQRGWLPACQLIDAVGEMVAQGCIKLPAEVVFAGFDELTSQQQYFVEQLKGAGAAVEEFVVEQRDGAGQRVACESSEQEIESAARWARQLLEDAQAEGKPLPNVGVVVADLKNQRRLCQVTFDHIFHPSQFHVQQLNHRVSAFNITLGPALSAWPMIRSGLDILEFVDKGLAPNDMGRWLRGRWSMGAQAEVNQRAALDVFLRRDQRDKWTARGLISQLQKERFIEKTGGCPILLSMLEQANTLRQDSDNFALPSYWCGFVSQLLTIVEWPEKPQSRGLNGDELQLQGAWNELLDRLSSFDAVGGKLSLRQFRQLLESEASASQFQPRSHAVPVQVMGLLEASGAEFDALWVCGLTDQAWPAMPRPNPLLPQQWQRERNLPHASVERELEYAQMLTQRLSAAAPTVVFSSALFKDDEALRPSPLIMRFDTASDLSLYSTSAGFVAADLEKVEEGNWQAIEGYQANGENKLTVSGGTRVIEDQAACGFRAFVSHRLNARPLEEAVFGLDSRERGTMTHEVLERVWKQLKNQANLQSKSTADLAAIVSQAIDDVTAEQNHGDIEFRLHLAEIESSVIHALVMEWLEKHDRERSPFTKVATEQHVQAHVGPLQLNVIADRIDTLPNGEQVVIDYKTSKDLSVADWVGERPKQPQLPVYAVTLNSQEKPVAAVMYGHLRAGKVGYVGLTDDEEFAPKVKPIAKNRSAGQFESLDEIQVAWRGELDRLATEYAQGIAVVDPKDNKSCLYCGLQSICRISAQLDTEEGQS